MTDLVQQASDSIADAGTVWTPAPLESYAKRASVGVTGGVVTAVGLVMIPAPTPFGCVVAAYGMSILATEFDGAQDAFENGKKKLQGGLEALAEKLQDDSNKSQYLALDNGEEEEEEGTSSNEGESQVETVEEIATEEEDEEKYKELLEIVTTETSVVTGAKRIWELHTNNMRRVGFHVISEVLLPALRNLNVTNRGESAESEEPQPTESPMHLATSTLSDVPGSTESVISNSTADGDSMAEPLLVKQEE